MKFDYYILNTYVPEADGPAPELYRKWLEQVQFAEQCGYDMAWITEHHFRPFGGMLPNPQVLLAALAAKTERIRLGTSVTILPLHHPLRIAEDLAMLDNLSGGRIEVGVGRGMPHVEYEIFDADWDQAQDWLEEAIAVMCAAWTLDPFVWPGRHYQYDKPISVMPPPLQRPHPPIWMTANRDIEHFRWIGRQGYHLMTLPWVLPDYELSRGLIAAYRESLQEAGHSVDEHEVLAMFPVHVAETDAEARAVAEPAWRNWRQMAFGERGAEVLNRMSYDRMVGDTRAIFGDPETCRRQVARLRDELGITRIACTFHFGGMPQQAVLASMRLFAAEVFSPA